MYNVLIVDDEREIRQGLRLKVNWEQLQLKIVGEAGNGEEAINILSTEHIDLILTDMKMPYRDGVSLLEYCYNLYPHLHSIVITGYDDFQYMRAAIKNKASEYLLKPVSRKELTNTLIKIVKEMNDESADRSSRQILDWKMSQYVEEIKNQFILNAVKPHFREYDVIEKRAALFNLKDLVNQRIRFIAIGLAPERNGSKEVSDNFHLPLELICRELAEKTSDNIAVFRDPDQSHLMFFIIKDDTNRIEQFIRNIEQVIEQNLFFHASFSIGSSAYRIEEWRESFISAVLAWKWRVKELPVGGEEAHPISSMLTHDKAKQLQQYLIRGERQPFEHLLKQQLCLAANPIQILDVKLVFQIGVLIEAAAQSLGLHSLKQEEMWVTPAWLWEIDTPDKAFRFLMDMSEQILKREKRTGSAEQSVVESIKEMIEHNYMMDINLGMLAEQYNYNASYLSDLFKQKTELTFIQYLTKVRMDKAVQLLKETELGLSEIAELTGFSNVSYFSSKFKKIFGINPSAFRHPE